MTAAPAIARNATLADLGSLLEAQAAIKHDAVVPATALEFDPDNGYVSIEGMGLDGPAGQPGIFNGTEVFDEHLADKFGIPLSYVRRIRERRPDLYAINLNQWIHGTDRYGPDDRNFTI